MGRISLGQDGSLPSGCLEKVPGPPLKRFGVKIIWFLSHRSFYIVTNFPKSDHLVLRSSSSQVVDEEEMWIAADEASMCLNYILLVRQCYAWSAVAGTPLLMENKNALSRNRKALKTHFTTDCCIVVNPVFALSFPPDSGLGTDYWSLSNF